MSKNDHGRILSYPWSTLFTPGIDSYHLKRGSSHPKPPRIASSPRVLRSTKAQSCKALQEVFAVSFFPFLAGLSLRNNKVPGHLSHDSTETKCLYNDFNK